MNQLSTPHTPPMATIEVRCHEIGKEGPVDGVRRRVAGVTTEPETHHLEFRLKLSTDPLLVECHQDGYLMVHLHETPGTVQHITFEAKTPGLEFTTFQASRVAPGATPEDLDDTPLAAERVESDRFLLLDEYSGPESLGCFSYTLGYTWNGAAHRYDPRIYNDGISGPDPTGRQRCFEGRGQDR